MSAVLEVIKKRRSVRRFRPEAVPDEALKMMAEAARLAPSAGNRQPWRFVVVKDPERKAKLAEACRMQAFIANAGAIIVALSDPKSSPRWHALDTMIAIEHMVLVAAELGLGTCWIGAFDAEEVKRIVNAPQDLNVVAVLPVGRPVEIPPSRPRKMMSEIFFFERYGNPLILNG